MPWKIIAIVVFIFTIVYLSLVIYGLICWQSETRNLHASIDSEKFKTDQTYYDPRELDALPEPVQRYFNAVLKEDQPLVTALSIEHTGTFNMSANGEDWKPFRSNQKVVIHRPGFVWDARIRMAPGLNVHVHDAYVNGDGILIANSTFREKNKVFAA